MRGGKAGTIYCLDYPRPCILPGMTLDNIIASIDSEIARLQKVRALLSTETSAPKRRRLSAAARKKIAAAQRKRWANVKKGINA